MIFVKYQHRLGNNLFQWAFARVLSRLSEMPMMNLPIPLFPGIANCDGYCIPEGIQFILPMYSYHVNLEEWVEKAKQGDVLIQGFPHNTSYYHSSKHWLIRELVPSDGEYAKAQSRDIVMHVRLGDYFYPHLVGIFGYPTDVFPRLLKSIEYERCLIVTDTPDSPVIANLVENHRGKLVSKDPDHDYRTLYYATRLIISPSTFSWWAAWTGCAKEIYQPYELGFWRRERQFALDIQGDHVKRFNVDGEIIRCPLN